MLRKCETPYTVIAFEVATLISFSLIIHTTELVSHVLFACSASGKSKAKKAKHASAVEPLQEGEEVTDTTGKKWKLGKLLSQSMTELIYEGET